MIRFDLRPSPAFRHWTIGITVICSLLILWLTIPLLLKVSLVLLLLIVMVWQLFRPHQTPHQVDAILYADNGWQLLADNQSWSVEWCDGSVVTPYFLALRWRNQEQKKKHYLLVWHDALPEDDYRHFCRLYWHAKPDDQ